MSAGLEIGVSVPQVFVAGAPDVQAVGEVLRAAEDAGLHSVWTEEQIFGGTPTLAPLALLNHASALTRRVRLGVAVLVTTLRNPVHLAKELASLDWLSGGRLIVGVGLGGTLGAGQDVYPAFGITPERRVARFTEGLRLMKRLWTEPRVTEQGTFWTVRDAVMEPKPVQRPHPPLWFGGHQARALQRAVELGDGFISGGTATVARFREQVLEIRRLLDAAGRDPSTFPIAKRVYLLIDADRARAQEQARAWMAAYYGRPDLADGLAVLGSPEECAAELAEIAGLGANLLVLHPLGDDIRQFDIIRTRLLPKLVG